jgi:hypothetical protein
MSFRANGPFTTGFAPEEYPATGPLHVTVRRWKEDGRVLISGSYRLTNADGGVITFKSGYPDLPIPWAEAVEWAEVLAAQHRLVPIIEDTVT